jgi:hypothetical protein
MTQRSLALRLSSAASAARINAHGARQNVAASKGGWRQR